MTGRRRKLAIVSLTAAALLTACAGDVGAAPQDTTTPEPTATSSRVDPDVPPTWTGDGTADGTVSFADGPALAAASGISFSNELAQVWDWEREEAPAAATTDESPVVTVELVNTGNGCRVLDERAPYEGASTDDGAASTALVEDRLAGAEAIAGPAQDLMGLGKGLGEDGATYNVARVLGRDSDDQWVLITARAFVALGEQQVITVSCATGVDIDLTHGQLAQVVYASLQGLDKLP